MKNNFFSPNQRKIFRILVYVLFVLHCLITLHYVSYSHKCANESTTADAETVASLVLLEEQNAALLRQLNNQQRAIQYAHNRLQQFKVLCTDCVYTMLNDGEE